ncbi:methyl-accepting chemotaxis protein [Brevibacillus daliensis]|uniref:methyl-accepting chemotaxis protein n=1 Tax=Brevibacillus daliensis TaxID=2892995 RepID=UPI001E31A834|nr:methyl-accepting chemotaxis protein [Brevibacillus daliensis]
MGSTIRKKIMAGFMVVLILLTLLGIAGHFGMAKMEQEYSHLINARYKKVILLQDMIDKVRQEQSAGLNYIITRDSSYLVMSYDFRDQFFIHLEDLKLSAVSKESQELLLGVEKSHAEFAKIYEEIFSLVEIGENDQVAEIMKTDLDLALNNLTIAASQFKKVQLEKLDNDIANTKELTESVKFSNIVVIIVAIVLSFIMAVFISNRISKPLKKITEAAKEIAAGNLQSEAIVVKSKDEIGQLAVAFTQMQDNLRELITTIREDSMQVAAASEQLYASAEQNSQATEQIASQNQNIVLGAEDQLHQVQKATSMNIQVGEEIQKVFENGELATTLTQKAADSAVTGTHAVGDVVDQMNNIYMTVGEMATIMETLNGQSKEIGTIVGMMSDIAAQTNLLALNAAIEAARAGEQGRGFAVVADEVRKLAEQSERSADQIAELIKGIQVKVEEAVVSMNAGSEKVLVGLDKTMVVQDAFSQIHTSVDEVVYKVKEVTNSVNDIWQGNRGIMQSFEIVQEKAQEGASSSQENAAASEEQLASMEEIASSAQSLSRLADHMQERLHKFTI